jgi:hypothetical protein
MLGMGMIHVAPESTESPGGDNFYLLFEGQRILVNRILFFQEGTAPIEQGLLIRYGELVKRQEIQERGGSPDYPAALKEIHEAGLRMAVLHEMDYAIERIEKGPRPDRESTRGRDEFLIELLERIKQEDAALSVQETAPDTRYLYKGVLSESAAFFMCFPFCMGSLMQAVDLNLEFFSIRFILNCLLRGVERNLHACVFQNRIVGLIFLSLKEQFLKRSLEIKYIATQRSKGAEPQDSSSGPPRGVGTFLVAGVWMLVRNEMQKPADIVLDAEVGARGFYETIGFESRGFAGFVLGRPRPYLLQAILGMARHIPDLRPRTVAEIARIIKRHVKALRKRPSMEKDLSERKAMIECVRECLMPDSRHEFMDAAIQGLLRYRKRILEAEDLLRYASELKMNQVKDHVHPAGASH